ncbi:MAG: arylsulfatase [Paenibacillus sp.]|nr:arylsulfatase [Paenibacillus sp.]
MSQPHILLISVDQMRGDLMGCAGHPVVRTPHIDFLAKRGVRFSHAVSTQPVCIPARASIMTGKDGATLGLTHYREGFEIPVRETLPQLLHDAGYQTQVVGKMHVYPERRHYGFENMLICEEGRMIGQAEGKKRGYDDYELWLAEQGYAGQAFGHGMANNEFNVTSWHLPDRLHPTEWVGSETCKAIKRRDWTRPLFLWASFTAPHPPLTPLMSELQLYERDEMPKPKKGDWTDRQPLYNQRSMASYSGWMQTERQVDLAYRGFYAMITHVDRQINRILGTLREEGMLGNTWICFVSDHGDNMGDHGLWGKTNFFKGSCHIPFILTPPLGSKALPATPGRVVDTPVALQDIMPTFLEAAGIGVPEALDGKSLLPIVAERAEAVRDTITGEYGVAGTRTFMVTDTEYKYMWFEEDGMELLFDRHNDPDELRDVAAASEGRTKAYRSLLTAHVGKRQSDPALQSGELVASQGPGQLSEAQIARQASHQNPRGLH